MGRVIGRWLVTAIPVVVVVSVLTFVLTSLIPGDAARTILGQQAPQEQVDALRAELGFDRPLHEQYFGWLGGVLHGDFGRTITTRGQVSEEIGNRIGVTLSILLLTIVVTVVVGVALGVISAVRGGWVGRLVDVLSLVGLAVPGYWLGLVLAALLAVNWRLFPATGYVALGDSVPGWIASLFLPVLTLSITSSSVLAKQTRTGVLDELDRDYVRMLRARGVAERRILLVHVLRNAAGPILTVVGLIFIGLVGGAVLIETVFVLPGLGSLIVEATKSHDIPVILAVTLLLSVLVLVVNLLVEIGYALLNPRVRT